MDKYKTLASNTMLISIGTLGSKLIVFFMVTGFIGSGANGIYTVAYKIPTILIILAGVFIEA